MTLHALSGYVGWNPSLVGNTATVVCRMTLQTTVRRHPKRQRDDTLDDTLDDTSGETFVSTLFSQPTPVIVQIRRELRGKLPDEWLEEVVSILEYQLTYQTVDELPTNDLLKLSLGASFSVTLKAALTQSLPSPSAPAETLPETPLPWRLPWQ